MNTTGIHLGDNRIDFTVTVLLGVALAGLAGGCADPRSAARPTALLLVDNIKPYSQGLEAEVQAQEVYYDNLNRVLKDHARRRVFREQRTARRLAVNEFADDLLDESRRVSVSKLQKFLVATDAKFDAEMAKQMRDEAEADAGRAASFAALKRKLVPLEEIEGELLELTRDPTAEEQLKRLIAFGKGVREQLKVLEAQDETKPATQPTSRPAEPPPETEEQ